MMALKKYFARANTASGCVNLIESNLRDIKSVYILSGESPSVKSEILKKLAEKSDNCECIYSPFLLRIFSSSFLREYRWQKQNSPSSARSFFTAEKSSSGVKSSSLRISFRRLTGLRLCLR